MRSGFVTFVGRPNVGKSTLLNTILGTKVSIVSDKPQTTRTPVRGVLTLRPGPAPAPPDAQVVFVDTPGIHKPKTTLGQRLNDTATGSIGGVDVVCLVLDATMPLGKGDRYVAERVPHDSIVVVNKVDRASPGPGAPAAATGPPTSSCRSTSRCRPSPARACPPSSTRSVARLPEGPQLYPDGMVTDVPEAFWVAELVREQLFAVMREELPYSVACVVTEWEWPRIRCEILVERDSQKGIVIGRKGGVLKAVGIAVREQLPEGAYLELVVKVDPNWQRRPKALERLGY